MTTPGVPASGSAQELERYLTDISVRLPGPPRARAAIIAELRSGLLDAADQYQSAGLPRSQAEHAAVGEFGHPDQVAGGFRGELAAGQARRVSSGLLASGPATGLLWIAAAQASHLTIRLAPPWEQGGLPSGLSAGIALVVAAVAVTACAAVLGIATTGRLARWLPDRPRRATTAAAVAGYGAVGADALGLALLAILLADAPGTLSPLLAAAAAVAGLVRLLLANRAARRCLAARATLAAR